MKKKDYKDLKIKTTGDLAKKVKELRREITEKNIELKMGKTKNVHEVNTLRKDVAKILTIMKIKSFEKENTKSEVKEK